MTNPTIKINELPNDLDLSDLLDLHKKSIFLNLNCHHIGTVQAFDSAKQTATVTINYQQTRFRLNPETGVNAPYLVAYPILLDCPVVFLGGGAGALTFPVTIGDECLVLFNDRDIDNWYQSGASTSGVASSRLHSISDGIILVGIRSANKVLPSFNSDAAELRYGDNTLAVFEDKIKQMVGDAVSAELNNLGKLIIQNETGELITALYNILTNSTAGGFPLIPQAAGLAILASFKE